MESTLKTCLNFQKGNFRTQEIEHSADESNSRNLSFNELNYLPHELDLIWKGQCES